MDRTGTEHKLPFGELSPLQFEELCLWLLDSFGHSRIEHWGAAGGESGCDLVSVAPDGKSWLIQAKRTERFTPALAANEIKKALDNPPDPEPLVYFLMATCSISRKTKERLIKEIKAAGKSWVVELCDLTRLDREVRRDPATLKRFFGLFESSKSPDRHWNVPGRNDYFTGRDDMLTTLEELVNQDGTAALTQTISGLGGIGKTQIAVEFCHRHRERYPFGIFWADASSADNLKASYHGFAVELGWIDSKVPVDEGAEAWLRRSRSAPGWLLVLDNADDPEQVDDLVPKSAQGHVVITTRHADPEWGLAPLRVDVWPLADAVRFLAERSGRQDVRWAEDLEDLAQGLGCLPLALEQAGAYLRQQPTVGVHDYLDGFRRRKIAFLEKKKSARPLRGDYEHTVATTWSISFDRLEPAAGAALGAMAFLDPDEIPTDFFLEFFKTDSDSDAVSLDLEDPTEISEQIVAPLRSYSLVEVVAGDATPSLRIHRLVQEVVLHGLSLSSDDELGSFFEKVHQALNQCFPLDPNSPESWKSGRRWMPHVVHGLGIWKSLKKPTLWAPTPLWARAGFNAWAAGFYGTARVLLEETLEVSRRVLGHEHPSTLTAMANLAESLRALGDANTARTLLEETLEVSRKILGHEHPSTLTTMANLAASLWALSDANAARTLLEETLDAPAGN